MRIDPHHAAFAALLDIFFAIIAYRLAYGRGFKAGRYHAFLDGYDEGHAVGYELGREDQDHIDHEFGEDDARSPH